MCPPSQLRVHASQGCKHPLRSTTCQSPTLPIQPLYLMPPSGQLSMSSPCPAPPSPVLRGQVDKHTLRQHQGRHLRVEPGCFQCSRQLAGLPQIHWQQAVAVCDHPPLLCRQGRQGGRQTDERVTRCVGLLAASSRDRWSPGHRLQAARGKSRRVGMWTRVCGRANRPGGQWAGKRGGLVGR